MQFVYFAGEILLATFILIVGYNYLSRYVFSKLKVNKWLILVIGVLILAVPYLPFWNINLNNTYYSFIFSIVAAMFFLWFLDLMGWTKKAVNQKSTKKNDIIIKPKAKPNRVKKDKK